jgi:hypothetical protein
LRGRTSQRCNTVVKVLGAEWSDVWWVSTMKEIASKCRHFQCRMEHCKVGHIRQGTCIGTALRHLIGRWRAERVFASTHMPKLLVVPLLKPLRHRGVVHPKSLGEDRPQPLPCPARQSPLSENSSSLLPCRAVGPSRESKGPPGGSGRFSSQITVTSKDGKPRWSRSNPQNSGKEQENPVWCGDCRPIVARRSFKD